MGVDDVCSGGTGRDIVRGGDDDDSLSGGTDDDRLFGEAGDDSLDGDEGRDKLFGGVGNDDTYDDDRLKDDSPEDDGENEGGGGSAEASTIVFAGNVAQVSGASAGKHDRRFYLFTAPTSGQLSVSLQPGAGGRYADLELEEVASSQDLLELEPSEGGASSGIAVVTAGRQYRMRLRSPDLAATSFTVDLAITPAP